MLTSILIVFIVVGEPEFVIPTITSPCGVAMGPDVYVVAGDCKLAVYSLSNNAEVSRLAIPCRSLCIAPDQRHYIVGGRKGLSC